MREYIIVIFWKRTNTALIAMDLPQHVLVSDVLDSYAKDYAFERKGLTALVVEKMECPYKP
jgi:hypothetical protein